MASDYPTEFIWIMSGYNACKRETIEELEKKSEMLNLRMKAIERQEEQLKEHLLKVRSQILEKAQVEKK